MKKTNLFNPDVIYFLGLIIADFFIFLTLGLLFMSYDDNYNESKGKYLSFESMSRFELAIYITINVWFLINAAVILFAGFKIYNRVKMKEGKKMMQKNYFPLPGQKA
ncbi:MAG: hypothetical protein QM791_02440 [Ferruginibacter sp.]